MKTKNIKIKKMLPAILRIVTNKESIEIQANDLQIPLGWPQTIIAIEKGEATHMAEYKLVRVDKLKKGWRS